MYSMKIMFDMDGVLCEERSTFERSLAEPIQKNIDGLNILKERGHFITIYTSRDCLS